MAKARMLHKKISVSLDVERLSLGAQLLFTWMISAADDEGKMKGDPQFVKATIVPLKKWTFSKVKGYLIEMKNQGLIYYWEQNGELVIQFPKWNEYQQIRKDRFEQSKLPSFKSGYVDQVATARQPDDNQMTTQLNKVESSQEKINKSEFSDKDSIGDNNLPYKEKLPIVGFVDPTAGGETKGGFVAYELFKKIEPGNMRALGNYVNYVKQVPHELLFQWASEIAQDPNAKNKGAVFNKRVKDYLEERGGGTGSS